MNKLSILLGKDSFFYLLTDNHSIISYKKWIKRDKKLTFSDWVLMKFQEDHKLKLIKPDHIIIGIFSAQYTLIPVPQYSEEHKNLYLERNTPYYEGTCWVDSITTADYIKIVYSVPRHIIKIKNYLGPNTKVRHAMAALISGFYQNYASNQGYWGLVHARNNQEIIIIYKDGKLHFSNVYTFRSDEDFYYFISLVLSKLKISPKVINLGLSGELYKDTGKHKWFKKHILNFFFCETLSPEFDKSKNPTPENQEVFDLINLYTHQSYENN